METKWASLVPYGMTVEALTDFLPLEVPLDGKTVRYDTLKVAERCEAELGEERWSFIEGCPHDWGNRPIPDGPITVGIDAGYVRDGEAKQRHFEVSVGKSTPAFKRNDDADRPSSKRFGCVPTLDAQSKRRWCEVWQSQGMQLNQQSTLFSDGSDTVRALQLYMSPEAAHILDWHHITMRLSVLDQDAQGLVHCAQHWGEESREKIERLTWALWHGHLSKARDKSADIESWSSNFEEPYPKFTQLRKAVAEFRTYIEHTRHLSPNYGERYRNAEAMATGFVESTVNQVVSTRFCKKQQRQWSKRGAHLLLQKLRSRSDPLQCWQNHTRAPEDEPALELTPGAMLLKPFTFHDEIRHQT
jgi:hypothetical protein